MKILLRIVAVMALLAALFLVVSIPFRVIRPGPLFAVLLFWLATGFWIWMLVQCGLRVHRGEHNKIRWLIAVLLTHIFGATIYYLVVENPPMLHAWLDWLKGKTAIAAPQPPFGAGSAQPASAPVEPAAPNTPKGPGHCPKCNATLPPDAPEGLCPRCLLQMNLGATTQFTGAGAGAPPPPVEEIAKHFPQLEILECLGRGGMGIVYKARQPRLNRFVALKILAPGIQHDAAFAERFLREAQALAKLNHANIVTVYDFGESDGLYFLLMEFVDGVTLRGLLREGKVVPEQAMAIVPRICEALQYAHEQGVVHRDIKPENVLMDKQGRVKIADFGIARMLGVEGQPAYTRDRYVVGTPYYMAPEQVEKPLSVDHRADIYSLGVVFYEMLTGELPLGRFASPSQKVQMDVRLDDVVMRALEKEPQLRYQHAGQVKTDVENISGVRTGATYVPPPPRAAPPPATITPAGSPNIFPSPIPEGEARFSRTALAGLTWTLSGGLFLLGIGAQPGNFFHSLDNPTPGIITAWAILLFVTMIIGWSAAGDIRRSGGKICGLWLAVMEGLIFPLLALDFLIFFLGFLAVMVAWGRSSEVPDGYQIIFWLSGIVLSMIADVLVVVLAWSAASRPLGGTPSPSSRLRVLGCVLPLAAAFVFGVLALGAWTVNLRRTRRVTVEANAPRSSPADSAEANKSTTAATSLNSLDLQKLNLQLEQAQAEVVRLKSMVDVGLATQDEVDTAQENVQVLQAQIRGDPVEVAQVKLDAAEKQFARKQQLHDAGLIAQADFDEASNRVDTLKLDLAQAQAMHPPAVFTPAPLTPAELQNLQEQLVHAQEEVARLTPLVAQGTASADGLSQYQEQVEVLQYQIANDPVTVAKANVKWAQKRVDDLMAANQDHGDQYSNAVDQLNLRKQELASALSRVNTQAEAEKYQHRIQAALAIADVTTRDAALETVAMDTTHGYVPPLDLRFKAALAVSNGDQRIKALANLSVQAAQTAQIELTEKILSVMDNQQARDLATQYCARIFATTGQRAEAVKIANGITDTQMRDDTLVELAK